MSINRRFVKYALCAFFLMVSLSARAQTSEQNELECFGTALPDCEREELASHKKSAAERVEGLSKVADTIADKRCVPAAFALIYISACKKHGFSKKDVMGLVDAVFKTAEEIYPTSEAEQNK